MESNTTKEVEYHTSETTFEYDAAKEIQLKNALQQWVLDEGYREGEISTEEVANLLKTDLPFLRNYFSKNMSSDFRTWRNELRIEKAKELIADHPEDSLNHIAQEVGFITRSNFYHYFKKITGLSPADYRDQIASRK